MDVGSLFHDPTVLPWERTAVPI